MAAAKVKDSRNRGAVWALIVAAVFLIGVVIWQTQGSDDGLDAGQPTQGQQATDRAEEHLQTLCAAGRIIKANPLVRYPGESTVRFRDRVEAYSSFLILLRGVNCDVVLAHHPQNGQAAEALAQQVSGSAPAGSGGGSTDTTGGSGGGTGGSGGGTPPSGGQTTPGPGGSGGSGGSGSSPPPSPPPNSPTLGGTVNEVLNGVNNIVCTDTRRLLNLC